MTRPTGGAVPLPALLVALLVTLLLAPVGPLAEAAPGRDDRVGPPLSPRRVEGALTRKVVVDWHGTDGRKSGSAPVPGIGTLTLVCRPRNTMVRFTPYDRTAETQVWVAKHEDKAGPAVAVKNVRVYRWAGADDDGRGGTGRSAHEGLERTL